MQQFHDNMNIFKEKNSSAQQSITLKNEKGS